VAWYVRNGEIVRIGNKSQGWSTAIVDLQVSYTEDIDRVQALLATVVAEIYADPEWHDQFVEEPTVAGVEQITGTAMTFRIIAKTGPDEQFAVQREFRERAKVAFDAAGVQAPVPTIAGTV
jgi:small conductance mechanosensitive channel